jgi:hypothetical protein
VQKLPGKIVSLWDIMKNYDVAKLAGVISYLCATEALAGKDGDGLVPPEWTEKHHRPHVEEARRQCELIELAGSVRRCSIFLRALKPGLRWLALKNQAKVLLEEIEGELRQRLFVFVSTAKAEIYDTVSKDWADIWAKFPSSKQDSERAIDCYALEQNTACVFHMMRVAEIGLRNIAKKVGVKLIDKGKRQPIEYATWDKVIQGINTKITSARALSHGPRKNKKLRFYSEAADQCTFIRDIWRNEVSHTRENFNEGEASGVVARVRDFMALLAKNL